MDEQTLNLLRRISRYVFIGVAVLLVLLLLLSLLRVSIGFWLWSTVETWATVRLGLDSDAAQLVTVILVSAITLLLPTLAWYFLWGKKQLYATGAVVGGQILIFLLVSTIGSGVCFDRSTGEPLCWYADIPSKGRVFSRTKGFDPETGIEFKQYTKEIAAQSKQAVVTPSQPVTRAENQTSNSPETKTITVDAQRMWTNTGIRVSNGSLIKIEASGQVNGSTRNNSANKWVGADGWSQSPVVTSRAVWVLGNNSSYMCLTGRVGNGSPFKVGSSYSFKATSSGGLFLGFNDEMRDEFGNPTSDGGLAWQDNAGSLNVTVRVEK